MTYLERHVKTNTISACVVEAFRCRTWGATLHDADPRPPRCTAVSRLNRRHERTAVRSLRGGEQLRSTWHAGAALVGEPVKVTWPSGAALVGRIPATGWLCDRARRHSDLISHQCRIVRKWRGILVLLASRRTFKSYVGRRTDRRLGFGTPREENRCSSRRSVKRRKKRKSPFSCADRSACPPLSLFSHDSLGKRNVLVAPRTSTNANRVTISGTGRKTRTHTHHVYLLGSSEIPQTYYLLRFLCLDSRKTRVESKYPKRKNTHYSPSTKRERERQRYLPGKAKKMCRWETWSNGRTRLSLSLARSLTSRRLWVRAHTYTHVYTTTRVRA